MNRLNRFIKGRARRRWYIYAAAFVIIMVIASYAVYSKMAWDAYSAYYQAQQSEVIARFDSALALPADSLEHRSDKQAAFAAAVITNQQQIDRDYCQPQALIAWQTVLPVIKAAELKCQASRVYLRGVAIAGQGLSRYLEVERAIAEAIQAAQTDIGDTLDEAAINEQISSWKQAREALAEINDDTSTEVQVVAAAYAKKLQDRWSELLEQYDAEDRNAYAKAVEALRGVYQAHAVVSDAGDIAMQAAVREFETAYLADH